ncbi:MAG TPA: class I SAM-dependent methyltransferase [Chryseosolibacter sp.]
MKRFHFLGSNPDFTFRNNIFYQQDFARFQQFERVYLSVREKEQRLYPDEIVKALPDFHAGSALEKEWRIRKETMKRVMNYLREKADGIPVTILEVGCGNGWLCSHLAGIEKSRVLGLDVNERELLQAARVFHQHENLQFACGDILTSSLSVEFDFIILAASIQYFRNPRLLLGKLLSLLAPGGEIHIVDSPFYDDEHVQAAATRSETYFEKTGDPSMKDHYFHHSYSILRTFNAEMMYDPASSLNRLRRKFRSASPFPWIRISGPKDKLKGP